MKTSISDVKVRRSARLSPSSCPTGAHRPGPRAISVTALPFRNEPLVLPRSVYTSMPSRMLIWPWWRETLSSSRTMSLSAARPKPDRARANREAAHARRQAADGELSARSICMGSGVDGRRPSHGSASAPLAARPHRAGAPAPAARAAAASTGRTRGSAYTRTSLAGTAVDEPISTRGWASRT